MSRDCFSSLSRAHAHSKEIPTERHRCVKEKKAKDKCFKTSGKNFKVRQHQGELFPPLGYPGVILDQAGEREREKAQCILD